MARITCPKCAKVLKVPPQALGKKVKCPNPACGQTIVLPAATTLPVTKSVEQDAFGLSPPEHDDIATPQGPDASCAIATRQVTGAAGHGSGHGPSASSVAPRPDGRAHILDREPDFEVLMLDGSVVGMNYETLRASLTQGRIDRFTRARPVDDLHYAPESIYGIQRKRKVVHPWQPIGSSGADELMGLPTLYRSKIYSHDGIIKIVATIVFAVVAVWLLYSVFSLEVESERVREVVKEESGGGVGIGLMRVGVLMFPQGYVFVLKCIAAIAGLLCAFGAALSAGWLCGLAFGVAWYLVYREESGGPPPDGYPWMFWKSWQHWWVARRVP